MSRSWACFHELLLGLDALTCPEDAVLNDEGTWLYQHLGHQEGLLSFCFGFGSHKGAGVGFRVVNLEVSDEVADLLEGANYAGHQF